MAIQIVIDTNVFISALRSQRGASFEILRLLSEDENGFTINLSVPLVFEYEAVALRLLHQLKLESRDVEEIIGYLCEIAIRHEIHYLWRPYLPDPKDDMLLELAVAAQCDYIVTHNVADFTGVVDFGVKALTPGEFLMILGDGK